MSTKVSVILAAGLLIVVFGVGVWVGQSTPQRGVAGAMQSAKAQRRAGALSELAACQEELETRATLLPTASVPVPEEAKSANAETRGKMEALEEELKQCKTRDMVFNAEMCTATRYFYLLLAGLHADKACVDRFGVGDQILKHTEQCAKFEDNQGDPAEMDLGKISDSELSKIYDAQRFGKRTEFTPIAGDHKANIARHFKRTFRECHTKFGLSDD